MSATDGRFLRLRERMRRARQAGEPFSFGVLRVTPEAGTVNGWDRIAGVELSGQESVPIAGMANSLVQALQPSLGKDEILVPLGGGTFTLLFPGKPMAEAREHLRGCLAIAWAPEGGAGDQAVRLRASTAVCEFREHEFFGDESAQHLARLLAGRESLVGVPAATGTRDSWSPESSDLHP